METITTRYRGDAKKVPVRTFKILGFEDCKNLVVGSKVHFLTQQGDVAQVKITSMKTWKTRPTDLTIGVKYGLRAYSHVYFVQGQSSGGEVLVKELE